MSKKSKNKWPNKFSIWWQSSRFRFIAASVVLVFITAVGTFQTASKIAVISDHHSVSKSSNLVLNSIANIQAAAANEETVILRLQYYEELPEDKRDFLLQQTKKAFITSSNQVQQEEDLVEKFFNDFDKSTTIKLPIIAGLLSIRSVHHRVMTNFHTFESMIDQQRQADAKIMYLATCESSKQLKKSIHRVQQLVIELQRISTAQSVEATNTLSWFSSLGWGCTALIAFCMMIATHVKQFHAQYKAAPKKIGKPIEKKSATNQPTTFPNQPAKKIETIPTTKEALGKARQEEIKYNLNDFTILIAEDGLHNRRFMKTLLVKYGAKVETVENGKEAVDFMTTAEGESIDLLLFDVQMPVMGGLEAISILRERSTKIPAIAITAIDDDSKELRCLEAGFTSFLNKPIDKNKLVNTIGEALKLEPISFEAV